jgi:hypothetical protein
LSVISVVGQARRLSQIEVDAHRPFFALCQTSNTQHPTPNSEMHGRSLYLDRGFRIERDEVLRLQKMRALISTTGKAPLLEVAFPF